MDVRSFANELLRALADTGLFEQVALRTEGPIADGQAYVGEELFLRFYFNEATGTMAFALVEKQQVLMQGGGIRAGMFLFPAER